MTINNKSNTLLAMFLLLCANTGIANVSLSSMPLLDLHRTLKQIDKNTFEQLDAAGQWDNAFRFVAKTQIELHAQFKGTALKKLIVNRKWFFPIEFDGHKQISEILQNREGKRQQAAQKVALDDIKCPYHRQLAASFFKWRHGITLPQQTQ